MRANKRAARNRAEVAEAAALVAEQIQADEEAETARLKAIQEAQRLETVAEMAR